MSQSGSTATLSTTILRKLGRLGRFILFVCTSGWLFPHASTEGMDLTKIQNDHMTKKK